MIAKRPLTSAGTKRHVEGGSNLVGETIQELRRAMQRVRVNERTIVYFSCRLKVTNILQSSIVQLDGRLRH
jgi:hypothetical protein